VRTEKRHLTTYAFVAFLLLLFDSTSPLLADSHEPLLTIYLFAASTCPECKEIKEEVFPDVLADYGGLVQYKHIRVDDVKAFKLQLLYEKKYGTTSNESTKLFVGTKCLAGIDEVKKSLARVIDEELLAGSRTIEPVAILSEAPPDELQEIADKVAHQKFDEFRPVVVALAGLVDGINPCAFVTLVFFISLLSFLKKSKREIFLVGLFFSISVFLTYMVLGFGILRAIKVFSVDQGIAWYLTLGMAVATFILAAYSFIDFVRYRKTGSAKDISLKLPHKIRLIINRLISTRMRKGHLVLGAIALGFVISLLEALCTGQVYLPTIMYVLQGETMMIRAMMYLVLYNVMFIVPLLVVFAMTYYGVSSETISGFFTRNIGLSKLIMSIVFLLLGLVLIFSIW
jgi:cytochrome c biogenesis protein CcdA